MHTTVYMDLCYNALYTVHCTVYCTLHCTLYNALYTIHCTVHTVYNTIRHSTKLYRVPKIHYQIQCRGLWDTICRV